MTGKTIMGGFFGPEGEAAAVVAFVVQEVKTIGCGVLGAVAGTLIMVDK